MAPFSVTGRDASGRRAAASSNRFLRFGNPRKALGNDARRVWPEDDSDEYLTQYLRL